MGIKSVIILGSAPDAVRACDFDLSRVDAVVALNNAWRVMPDWTHSIYPEDFPEQNWPIAADGQHIVTHDQYVPANNAYGGIVYAGGTMAFTAAYWALSALKPDVLLFCGCDMVYDQKDGQSHFYGAGIADPLRKDPTLQSLEAKANRLLLLAAEQACALGNLSDRPTSRLTFPHFDASELGSLNAANHQDLLSEITDATVPNEKAKALNLEKNAENFVKSGNYWNFPDLLDAEKLQAIDQTWERAYSEQ